MGRKPNQLILEFFERGQKLEDASNRYQHTCKACGEKFPKGRIDSLTQHLVKKCHAIPLRDRQRALLQLHELPDVMDGDSNGKEGGGGVVEKGGRVELPFAGNRSLTGLEALAEASRQIERKISPAQGSAPGEKVIDESAIDPSLRSPEAMPPAVISKEHEPEKDNAAIDSSATMGSAALPPMQFYDSPSASPHLPGLSLPSSVTDTARNPSQLSMIAASASNLEAMLPNAAFPMEPDPGVPDAGVSDKFFHPQAPRTASTWPLSQGVNTEPICYEGSQDSHTASIDAITSRAATFPRPIAMNPNGPHRGYTTDFNTSARPSRPKVRGRFTPSRRKEVQEVRKRGACLRCRMLKKPCSGGNPCSTCGSVESARLWKQPCIRTRIADELELYSAGLHAILAYHDVSQAKSHVQFQHYPGCIQVTHDEKSCVYISFSALEGHKGLPDPAFGGLDDFSTPRSGNIDLRLLDGDSDDLPGKLELYMKEMAPTFYDQEPSQFMNPTLRLASELSDKKQDMLLMRVLELWTATHILVDIEMRWKTFSNPERPPSSSPTSVHPPLPSGSADLSDNRTPIDDSTNPRSYALLCSQLRSAAEKRAAQLSKGVMNDLERRLLQRQHSGWFETFLVAMVLLNCVERASWLFWTWEDEQYYSKWPLERRPPYYLRQGENFSHVLHMLLKMRGLPPRTQANEEDGILAAVEGSDEAAVRWFDTIKVSNKQLVERQAADFNPQDSRSLELKFCSKLLLSTN